jgi:hypothetical protein
MLHQTGSHPEEMMAGGQFHFGFITKNGEVLWGTALFRG